MKRILTKSTFVVLAFGVSVSVQAASNLRSKDPNLAMNKPIECPMKAQAALMSTNMKPTGHVSAPTSDVAKQSQQ